MSSQLQKGRGAPVVSFIETLIPFMTLRLHDLITSLYLLIKNLPAMQEPQVRSLAWEDPLEERMAIHSSILAWRILWTEEPGGLQLLGSHRVGHD